MPSLLSGYVLITLLQKDAAKIILTPLLVNLGRMSHFKKNLFRIVLVTWSLQNLPDSAFIASEEVCSIDILLFNNL